MDCSCCCFASEPSDRDVSTCKSAHVSRGNFFSLFSSKQIFVKYISCIFIGLPIWYIIGVLVALSRIGLTAEMGLKELSPVLQSCTLTSDFPPVIYWAGLLSQYFKSRKNGKWLSDQFDCAGFLPVPLTKSLICILLLCVSCLEQQLGIGLCLLPSHREQFGTNIRSTVTNTVPNFVRGAVVPITLLYKHLNPCLPGEHAKVYSALLVGVVCLDWHCSNTVCQRDLSKQLNYIKNVECVQNTTCFKSYKILIISIL